ncbi:UNVERIFIED_CONTAM: hypothetical protein HDU68_003520 [Siphonaria sp. JEL0065]|nr:hypothetical protein HDU68_003520 [Siphonaria sp. JEL0065]
MVRLALVLAGITCAAALNPSSIKNVVAFGDSLSDNGNLFKLYGIPPAPYWNGRFCNGPVWVEQLSEYLSNATLYDFAYAGATANVTDAVGVNITATILATSVPDIAQQLATFEKDPVASKLDHASTLYTVFAGGNDINYLADQNKVPDVLSIAGSVVSMVASLVASGAKNVLLVNMPPLQSSPRLNRITSMTAQIKQIVDGYNQVLAAGVAALSTHFPEANIVINDINGLLTYVATPEGASVFNFANVGDVCLNSTAGTICSDPNSYFFWDGIHPSTRGQSYIAQYAYNQLFKLPGYTFTTATTTTTTTTVTTSTSAATYIATKSSTSTSVSATSTSEVVSTTNKNILTSSTSTTQKNVYVSAAQQHGSISAVALIAVVASLFV